VPKNNIWSLLISSQLKPQRLAERLGSALQGGERYIVIISLVYACPDLPKTTTRPPYTL
jgi:hypothetical protein